MASPQPVRFAPELSFVASVALKFEAPRSIGETPDGVRFHFTVQGTLDGPQLKGTFPPCAAYLMVDREGIGTINVRAPLLLQDGALAELEATGRYDFGADGYRRAAAGDLPNSALGWCPRLTTGNPKYQWLNRVLHVGVGELRPREARVDYDLFAIHVGGAKDGACPAGAANDRAYPSPSMPAKPSYGLPEAPSPKSYSLTEAYPAAHPTAPAYPANYPTSQPASYEPRSVASPAAAVPGAAPAAVSPLAASPLPVSSDKASLYERLGGQSGIDGIARDFVDALLGNVNLNRQNRKVAVAHSTVRGEKKQHAVQLASDMFCKLTGGPCEHRLTRPLRDTHIHLDITDSDWSLMRVDLDRVLVKHHVAKAERDELMAIVERTKVEIVK